MNKYTNSNLDFKENKIALKLFSDIDYENMTDSMIVFYNLSFQKKLTKLKMIIQRWIQ